MQFKPLLFIVIVLICSQVCFGQQLNYSYTNYTLEKGLPSNECHKIIEDSTGLIWIATDRGFSRFDGYTFKNYGIEDGLEDIFCLNIVIAPDKRIWIYTASHKIFIYDPDTDRINRYKHDELLEPYKNVSIGFDILHIEADNKVYFQAHNYGIVIIDDDANIELINQHEPCFFIETINDLPLISYDFRSTDDLTLNKSETVIGQVDCLQYRGKQLPLVVNNQWKGNNALRVFDGFSSEFILASIRGINFFLNDFGLLGLKEVPHTIDLIRLKNGHLLSAHLSKGGLRYYRTESQLQKNQFTYLLSDVSATSLLRDQQDNIWVSTLEDGIFYLKEKDVKMITDINLAYKKINHLEKDDKGNIFMIVDNTQLASYNTISNSYTLLHDFRYKIYDLNYNAKINKLIISAFASSTLDLAEKQPVNLYYADETNNSLKTLISSTSCDLLSGNKYVMSRRNGFSMLDERLKNQVSEVSEMTATGVIQRVVDFKQDQILIAAAKGIFTYDKESGTLDTITEFLGQRFNDILKYSDKYYFASQGKGLIVWDGDSKTYSITQKNGLLSDNIENLYLDSNDKMHICTYQGLSTIDIANLDFDNLENIGFTNYSKFQGLPSPDVYDVIEIKGDLYIATGRGLAIIPKNLTAEELHLPLIDKIKIQGKEFSPEDTPDEQSYNNNNLSIQYKSLDMKMLGNISYRHRLNNNPWVETMATQVDFSSLGPGEYSFNLQSKNSNGKWSESVNYDFTIKTPFWQKWWFLPLTLLASLCFFWYVFSRYRGRVKLEEELRTLEKSALVAQMNPHFIFNSLNSIQNFIMINNKEQAMNYLAQFAKLIRQNLNASSEITISLHQEIDMLRSYLSLEKLRFKNIFDYNINIEPNLDLGRNFISPMLIQPFVENAVVHGMSSLDSDGLIEISFSQDAKSIFVTVTDNGRSGKAREEAKKNSKHKSKGVSITSKRLAYINKEDPKQYQIVPDITDQGTTVKLRIAKSAQAS